MAAMRKIETLGEVMKNRKKERTEKEEPLSESQK